MTCYVDDMRAPFGRMKMCHMIADSHRELCAMALRIGVARRWIQNEGTYQEHFDLSLTRRRRAIDAGAVEVTIRELVQRCVDRRSPAELAAYRLLHPKPPDPPAPLELDDDHQEAG